MHLYSTPRRIHHVLVLAKLQTKTFVLHISEEQFWYWEILGPFRTAKKDERVLGTLGFERDRIHHEKLNDRIEQEESNFSKFVYLNLTFNNLNVLDSFENSKGIYYNMKTI